MEIIAIIGRPNVGKSSLFNRIIGTTKTIVNEKSGVTRDRVYESVELDGKWATFIDTGGFEPEKGDRIKDLILKQTEAAIEEADKIIILFDGKSGLHPGDKELINKLRGCKKDVFYAINKVDLKAAEDNLYDFYSLGIDDVSNISASQGTGVKDFLKKIASRIKQDSEEEGAKDLESPGIAIVGRPNVGKSSIVNRLLNFERVMVDDRPGTTRDSVDTEFSYNDNKYVLIDTAGIRRRSKIDDDLEVISVMSALKSIDRAAFVVLVIDASREIASQDLKIVTYAQQRGKALITVVNKIDKVEDYKKIDFKEFKERLAKLYPALSYIPFIFTSATLGENINLIMKEIEDVRKFYKLKLETKELNKFIKETKINEKIKYVKGRRGVRGKIKYITQSRTEPPRFLVFCNYPEFIKEKHDVFLKNQFRKKYSFSGVPIEISYRNK